MTESDTLAAVKLVVTDERKVVLCDHANSRSEYCADCIHGRPHKEDRYHIACCETGRCRTRHLKVRCRRMKAQNGESSDGATHQKGQNAGR